MARASLAIPGHGVEGLIHKAKYYLGNRKLLTDIVKLPESTLEKMERKIQKLEENGYEAFLLGGCGRDWI